MSAHQRGLQRGWNASLLAFVLYLGGLAGYAWLGIDSVDVVVAELSTDTLAALLASSPLPGPMTIVTAATAPLADGVVTAVVVAGLVVAIGFLALPLAIGVTVVKYGRGSAYLYVAAVAVPVCWTVARPFVQAPLAADLLALGAVPLVGGAWFLVDIGRYLRSAA